MFNKKEKKEAVVLEEVTFFQRHAKKIYLVSGIAVAAGVGYILKKHDVDVEKLNIEKGELWNALCDMTEQLDVINAAASEGLYEEALATTIRKLNSRKDRLEFILSKDIVDNTLVINLQREIAILTKRKDSFIKAQKVLGIGELDAK